MRNHKDVLAALERRPYRHPPLARDTLDARGERLGLRHRSARQPDWIVAQIVDAPVERRIPWLRGRRAVVRSPPPHHSLHAHLLCELALVAPGERSRVLLVERGALVHGHPGLVERREHQTRGADRAAQRGCVHDIEKNALRAQQLSRLARLDDALLGQVDIHPAREQVGQIPFALPVAQDHQPSRRCRTLLQDRRGSGRRRHLQAIDARPGRLCETQRRGTP